MEPCISREPVLVEAGITTICDITSERVVEVSTCRQPRAWILFRARYDRIDRVYS